MKIQPRRFDRKVREALEIQFNECGPKKGGINLDDGQYVKTKFWTPLFRHLRKKQSNVSNDRNATSNNSVTLQRSETLQRSLNGFNHLTSNHLTSDQFV